MSNAIKRIAIVGPESTGKSTLSKELAIHFETVWVPEFARIYLSGLIRAYTFDDLLEIAKNQILLEEEVAKTADKIIFCDTNLLVVKIWSQHRFRKVHSWVEEELQKRKYDLHLLCDIDFPWEDDPLRAHPHLRQYFFDWYKKELETAGTNYKIVSGVGKNRFKNAIDLIKN